jgi:hypothetical protein
MTGDSLFSIALSVLLLAFFCFVFVAPAMNRRRLRKNGIRTIANVKSAEKTMVNLGDGSFSIPIYRLQLHYDYAGNSYAVSKRHGITHYKTPPKPGDVVWIIVDPQKPTEILMDF